MSDIVVLDVTVDRLICALSPHITAKQIAPFLDAGDWDGAISKWHRYRAEAEAHVASKKGVPDLVRTEALRQYVALVRAEIVKLRGSATLGIKHRSKTDDGRTIAKILAFPTRKEPLPVPSFAAWDGPVGDLDERVRWSAREMFGSDA